MKLQLKGFVSIERVKDTAECRLTTTLGASGIRGLDLGDMAKGELSGDWEISGPWLVLRRPKVGAGADGAEVEVKVASEAVECIPTEALVDAERAIGDRADKAGAEATVKARCAAGWDLLLRWLRETEEVCAEWEMTEAEDEADE